MFSCNFAAIRGSALVLALALAAPAVSNAEIFAWRTDDGVFAYADDHKKVPARYAPQAVRVNAGRFGDYHRLTVQDSVTSRAVQERLRERLSYLRAFNHHAAAEAQAQSAPGAGPTVTVATGSPQAPTVDVPASHGDGPLVVETVLGKDKGDMVTRPATIVTQGGRTLAVLKGRRTTHNLSDDIVALDEIDH